MWFFLINLFATVLLYAVLPLLVSAFRKKPITLKAYRRWPIIISVIIVFVLSFCYFIIGTETYAFNAVPAILWTWVGLSIGESILRKRGLMVSQEEYDATQETEEKEEKTYPVLAVILGIIAVGILVLVGVFIGVSI